MSVYQSVLKPGLLVSLKTTIHGNVRYATRVLEADRVTEAGTKRAKWETEREITDPVEFEIAKQTRAKARHAVARICAASNFGLLCPQSQERELEAAVAEARQYAEEFNATARYSNITVYVMTGRIAADDVEAVKAINSEIRDLMQTMENGISKLDAEAIRDAANKARGLQTMLSREASERVSLAIEAARVAARRIVKAGEGAAREVDEQAIKSISAMRMAFIDMDMDAEVQAPASTGRAVDLTPETPVDIGAVIKARGKASLEMEV